MEPFKEAILLHFMFLIPSTENLLMNAEMLSSQLNNEQEKLSNSYLVNAARSDEAVLSTTDLYNALR